MSNKVEPVELCVILPYQDFISKEKRAKKGETADPPPSANPEKASSASQNLEEPMSSDLEESVEVSDSEESIQAPLIPPPKAKKKELKNMFRATQIKKVLKQIERTSNSEGITNLENLDSLIKSLLGTSKKILPNEREFFTFIFENNLGHFCRNRSKIDLYYKFKDNWWSV